MIACQFSGRTVTVKPTKASNESREPAVGTKADKGEDVLPVGLQAPWT